MSYSAHFRAPTFRSYKPMSEEVATADVIKLAKPEKLEEQIEEHLVDTQDTTVIDEVVSCRVACR